MQRGDPKVWSIQTSSGCFHARKVVVEETSLETVFKPDKRQNPRAFFKGKAHGYWVQTYPPEDSYILITEIAVPEKILGKGNILW